MNQQAVNIAITTTTTTNQLLVIDSNNSTTTTTTIIMRPKISIIIITIGYQYNYYNNINKFNENNI